MIDFEQELRTQLRHRAEAAPARGGWDGIHRRVALRERARRTRNVCTTVAVVALLTAGTVALAGRAGTSTPSTDPASAPAGDLPRLVFRLHGFEPTFAFEHDPGSEPAVPSAVATGGLRLSVFAEPGAGYGGKVLFVTTAAPGTRFGIGDASETATQLAIGGQTGYLQTVTGLPTLTLGWRLPDGQAVYLVGLRLSAEELATAARGLRVDGAGEVSWPAGPPPGGLELRRSTVTSHAPRRLSEVNWVKGSDSLSLRLQEGGPDVLGDLIADRAASAREIGETHIEGVPAVITNMDTPAGVPGSTSVIWQVRDGVVAELVGEGAGKAHAFTAAASLVEATEAEWQALLDRGPPRASRAPQPPMDPPDGAALAEVCGLRATWLGAQSTGDAGTREKATDAMRRLHEKGSIAGWGSAGDILAVIKRLSDAMAIGDVRTVISTPAGGSP